MRSSKNLVLAGVAALALTSSAGLALAQSMHSMTVRMPDGGIAQILYAGDVPPKVAFTSDPLAAEYTSRASPFAMIDRISAQMDRDMDALMSNAGVGPPTLGNHDGMLNADMRNLSLRSAQYSVISNAMAGDGSFCARSMEVTRTASGAPHVVTHSSGDCRNVGNIRFGAAPPAPQHRETPPIETRAWPNSHPSGPALLNVAYQPAR